MYGGYKLYVSIQLTTKALLLPPLTVSLLSLSLPSHHHHGVAVWRARCVQSLDLVKATHEGVPVTSHPVEGQRSPGNVFTGDDAYSECFVLNPPAWCDVPITLGYARSRMRRYGNDPWVEADYVSPAYISAVDYRDHLSDCKLLLPATLPERPV